MSQLVEKKTPANWKVGDGTPGPGRPKGVPNKSNQLIKDAVIQAAIQAGNDIKENGGLVAYLQSMAKAEPVAFVGLLSKVLPMQVAQAKAEAESQTAAQTESYAGANVHNLGDFKQRKI